MTGIINKRQPHTPDINLSSDSSNINGGTDGLYRVTRGNKDGGGGDDSDLDGDGFAYDNNVGGNDYGHIARRNKFMLVKASDVTVASSIGTNIIANPHLQFYEAMRRLMYSQGEDGELSLTLLTEIEKNGSIVFTNEKQLKEEIRQCPEVAQSNRAILTALLNYRAGIARGMVEYGVEHGLDAWRTFYHRYTPLAEDLHQLLIQELYALTLVTESTTDTLCNKVERIAELYARYGAAGDQISDEWIKAAVMRNLIKQITTDLAMQLKDAKTTGKVKHILNI